MKKAIVLLDGANLYHCQEARGIEVDLGKLRDHLVAKLAVAEGMEIDLIGVFYRNAALPGQVDAKNREYSAYKGFTVEMHTLKTRPAHEAYCEACGKNVEVVCSQCSSNRLTRRQQKGVDVGLATDLLTLAFRNAFDIAVLVSGDQDFIGPIKWVTQQGKKVYNAFFGTVGKSDELAQECYDFWPIEDFEKEIMKSPFAVTNWAPFIEALDKAESFFKSKGGFVGLSHFADRWVTPAMGTTTREDKYKLVNLAIEQGIVIKGSASQTTKIQLNRDNDIVKGFLDPRDREGA